MDFDLFTQIADEIAQNKLSDLIVFVGEGDPLLYPKFPEAINYCQTKGLSTKVITNGLILNRDKLKILRENGLDGLSISLHGLSPEAFDYRQSRKKSYQSILSIIL